MRVNDLNLVVVMLVGMLLFSTPFIYVVFDFAENGSVFALLAKYPARIDVLDVVLPYLEVVKRTASILALLVPLLIFGIPLARRAVSVAFVLLSLTAAGWGQPLTIQPVASPAGSGSAEPFLFATKQSLLLTWLEPVAKTDRVALRFARYTGGTWSAPRTIAARSDFFVNWADFPSIVEDANGVLFAHWLQKSGKSTYAYDVRMAASRDGGKTWSPSFLLNRDGKQNEHGFVSLAPLPGGGVGAAWLDGRNMPKGKEEGEMTVRYATVDARGAIRSDVQLDDRTCECCATGMTLIGSDPVIVYRDRSADELRDIAVVRRRAKKWTKPAVIHSDGWKIAGCPVNGPQIDASGRALAVAWFTAADNRQRVYVAFSDDAGRTFAEPVAVDDGRPVGRVDLVLLDASLAFVTWIEQTAAGAEVRGRMVARNLPLQPSIKIADSSAARGAGFPRIARLGHDLFVAWTEQTATDKRIRVARVTF